MDRTAQRPRVSETGSSAADLIRSVEQANRGCWPLEPQCTEPLAFLVEF